MIKAPRRAPQPVITFVAKSIVANWLPFSTACLHGQGAALDPSFGRPLLWRFDDDSTQTYTTSPCPSRSVEFMASASASCIYNRRAERPVITVGDFPPTSEQDDQQRSQFISAISLERVSALALRYSTQDHCRVIKCDSGSFNVNFIVEFRDKSKCVVRIPILPFVYDPWSKVLSHVAVSKYLKETTQIPVARVRAFGRNERLSNDGNNEYFFLILDFIPGQSLTNRLLFESTVERRANFFSQLIEILVELRQTSFPALGSLMPGTDTGLPAVGDLQSIPLDELRRSVPPTTSVREYMESQLQIVSDTLAVPVADQAIDDMKLEAFAVHFMEKDLINTGPDDEENGYPLYHSDLRLANIIVNDELQINGVIDWDDASTVPKQLFSPPPWISGVDDQSIMEFQLLHAEFRGILVAKSKTNSFCGEMLKQWYGETNGEPNKALYVAHIIRCPTELAEVVARLHKRLGLIGKLRTDIHAYYKSSIAVQEEVQKRAALCDEYTSYLKNRGLYKEDRPLDLKELKANLERVEEMLRSHGL